MIYIMLFAMLILQILINLNEDFKVGPVGNKHT